MLSMKRIWCGSFCMITEPVRTPSPKKRTRRISAPSVTPVAAKMICSPGADVGDQLFMTFPIEDDDHEVLDAAAQRAGDRPQVFVNRRVQAHDALRAGTDDELLHVEVGSVQQSPPVRRRKNRNRVGCPG